MVSKSATADFDAGVSKDGHGPQCMWPSFETRPSDAPQDEVAEIRSVRRPCAAQIAPLSLWRWPRQAGIRSAAVSVFCDTLTSDAFADALSSPAPSLLAS